MSSGLDRIILDATKSQGKIAWANANIASQKAAIDAEFAEYNGLPILPAGSTVITALNTSDNTLTVNVDGVITHTITVKSYDDGRIYYTIPYTLTTEGNPVHTRSAGSVHEVMHYVELRKYLNVAAI